MALLYMPDWYSLFDRRKNLWWIPNEILWRANAPKHPCKKHISFNFPLSLNVAKTLFPLTPQALSVQSTGPSCEFLLTWKTVKRPEAPKWFSTSTEERLTYSPLFLLKPSKNALCSFSLTSFYTVEVVHVATAFNCRNIERAKKKSVRPNKTELG